MDLNALQRFQQNQLGIETDWSRYRLPKLKVKTVEEKPVENILPRRLDSANLETNVSKLTELFRRQGYVPDDENVFLQVFRYAIILKNYKSYANKNKDNTEYKTALRDVRPQCAPYIAGNTGSGKTTLADFVKRFCAIPMKTAFGILLDIQSGGIEKLKDFSTEYSQVDMIIDDVGSETTLYSFGNQISIAPVITVRYEAYKRYGSTTLFTSNCSVKEIAEKYGERIGSRLQEMVYPVIFNHSDRRRICNKEF